MWRNKLRTPLSAAFIRKTLTPINSTLFTQNKFTQLQNPIYFSTLPVQTRVSRIPIWKGCNFCSKQTGHCWNCKSEMAFLVCQSCGSVQPVDHSVDYFKIFGLERKFDIEEASLEGKYKDWQKKLHPDLVHTKSEEEREYAAEQSARVIDAYTTLRKPLSRAIYIMRLKGVEVDEEETVTEPELLGEIMEIREAVEEATDSHALNTIQAQMKEKLSHWSDSFASAFQSQNYDEALKSIRRMRYYHRVQEEIIKKL